MESTSLALLHSVHLDMLVKFDKFCSDNKLTYFLDSGTALGAVRHSGFIPWDDDVDVGMPRKDYEALLRLGTAALPENLFLQTYETDPHYFFPFGKIRLGHSFYPDREVEKMKYQGLYIDSFPYDKVPANKKKAARRIRYSRLLWFICVFCRRSYPGKKLFPRIVSDLTHRFPEEWKIRLYKLYDKYCVKYNPKETESWTCYCWTMSQEGVFIFDQRDLFPTDTMTFEGMAMQVPQDADSFLSKVYGDYHVLPPEEKRTGHLKGRPFRLE